MQIVIKIKMVKKITKKELKAALALVKRESREKMRLEEDHIEKRERLNKENLQKQKLRISESPINVKNIRDTSQPCTSGQSIKE